MIMTGSPHETPFQYEEALLSSCASSPLAQILSHQGEESADDRAPPRRETGGDACRDLFAQHAAHYRRPPPTAEEDRSWDAAATSPDGGDAPSGGMTPRTEAFLRSVMFVHRHNARGDRNHEVALNRFSDLSPEELPLMPRGDTSGDASPFGAAGAGVEFERWDAAFDSLLPRDPLSFLLAGEESRRAETPAFVSLDSEKYIAELGEKLRRKEQQLLLRSELGDLAIGGRSWWWVGGGHKNDDDDDAHGHHSEKHRSKKHRKKHEKTEHVGGTELLDIAQSSGLAGKKDRVEGQKKSWHRYLNWATEDNPDGVPIVHEAIDQGLCGSCWAISALGSLEASIARNMAYVAYEEAFKSAVTTSYRMSPEGDPPPKHRDGGARDARKYAVLAAQLIEQQSIDVADLSVQELIDCDTRYNQGCAGGNPLLAFYFLHRFGVTSKKSYPYTAKRNSCSMGKVDEPIAKVETWGVLTPDHEDNMEKVLRYIGPVAVGLIGADPAFLSYKKGIFTSTKGGKCDFSQADHAMLITGYGEEKTKHGVQRYWIARNSWGAGWGENGYIRIARSGGKKGERGECDIARSPSVALGGTFTKDVNLGHKLYGSTLLSRDSRSRHSGHSFTTRASTQIRSGLHRIRTRLGFIEEGIEISTNNGSETNDLDMMSPYVLILGMFALCLFFVQMHLKRREARRQGDHQLFDTIRRLGTEDSIASNWSTIVLYNGNCDHGRANRNNSNVTIRFNDGEKMHLLENSTGSHYT